MKLFLLNRRMPLTIMGMMVAAVVFTCIAGVRAASVVNSVHNLSASGPGAIKAVSETDACVFCHTAHHNNGVTPLWNHAMSSVSNYVVYSSARLDSLNLTIPQPNGSSRLCLSCHDGTVALGNISSQSAPVQMQGGVTTMTSDRPGYVGTDLSNDHPISFVYDAALAARDPEVVNPATLTGKVRLDSQGRLQCTSCHDPHDNQFGNFMVMDNTGSALCMVCHQPSQWTLSQHAVSSVAAPASIVARVSKAGGSVARKAARIKSTTVHAMGCDNCHVSHQAGSRRHLLQLDQPEQNCLECHNGITSKNNIASEFQKLSTHPVTLNSSAHSPNEDPVNPQMRHAVCADCHNPHAASSKPAMVPNASGALAGVTGVGAAGGIIKPLQKEYELCFRCHADSVNRGPAIIQRQQIQTNTRLDFSGGNRSYHPVTAVGKNLTSVPSLIAPWTTSSQMYCTDCHNSDSGPKAGGSGANGPHGSLYPPILERNLAFTDYQPESPATYALCYKCHDRNKLLSPQSFPLHNSHVVDQKAACTTCHDSHGVANTPHLINFNTQYVTNSSLGVISYRSTGMFKGTCTLSCHGYDHKNTPY